VSVRTHAVRAPDALWEDVDDGVEALLDEWHVAVGDVVEAGQAIAELMIVKTSFELEAPVTGEIADILVHRGESFGRCSDLARMVESE
jgi:pyruvate/2-oxoglutarate dehydrogenase complex dihydrolipoamide acyltransferase (E2) component